MVFRNRKLRKSVIKIKGKKEYTNSSGVKPIFCQKKESLSFLGVLIVRIPVSSMLSMLSFSPSLSSLVSRKSHHSLKVRTFEVSPGLTCRWRQSLQMRDLCRRVLKILLAEQVVIVHLGWAWGTLHLGQNSKCLASTLQKGNLWVKWQVLQYRYSKGSGSG